MIIQIFNSLNCKKKIPISKIWFKFLFLFLLNIISLHCILAFPEGMN